MGSPLTITATVCACAGLTEPGKTIPSAQAATQLVRRRRRRCENVAVMIMFDLDLCDFEVGRTAIRPPIRCGPYSYWRPLAADAVEVLASVRRPMLII